MTELLLALENPIKDYAWGSTTSLRKLRGEPSSNGGPEAELWMGAHPGGPSRVRSGSTSRPLPELINEAPEALLGARVRAQHGARLPFLLKLLAAAEPLSLQAHPSLDRARVGYQKEEALGIPRDAPHRNYKDASHKPELICALTRFFALVGFRPIERTLALFRSLDEPVLAPLVDALALQPPERALRTFFELAITASGTLRRDLVSATISGCEKRIASGSEFAGELEWALRIARLHRDDPGIAVALALNLVVLDPGQALYLPAGNLHAYLQGTGVEIMASSDNVLRGGLTRKHVDVPELLEVLDFHAAPAALVTTTKHGSEIGYFTPAREFALSRFDLAGESATVAPVTGPEILVATAGSLDVRRGSQTERLASGHAVFVPCAGGDFTLSGTGTAFRARVNDA